MQLPSVTVDLSSGLVTVVIGLLTFLGNRAIKGIDTSIKNVDNKLDSQTKDINQKIESQIKDVRLDISKTGDKLEAYRDRATDSITAVRLALEDKHEILDDRIRKLETRGKDVQSD